MFSSSRSLSVPEFLRKSTLGPDGNPFLETIRRPIFNAWSVDTCHRDPAQYKLVSGPKQLHQDTVPDGCGALSLEHLVRRQIIKNHLGEINESMLRRLEWFGRGKKLWEDVLASGEDSWRVFAKFCEVYGHERDFVAMLEDGGAGLTTRGGKEQVGVVYSSEGGKVVKKTTTCTGNDFRYRTQLIKDPLPPWQSSIPLLTAPTPKFNNGDFSWLVCFELSAHAFNGQAWSDFDLHHSLGTLPNLAVLSIHGSSALRSPFRIVQEGYLDEWARQARQGHKWGSLRILIVEEKLDALLDTFRPPPRHHTDLKKVPPPPPPQPRRGLFEQLDCFPKLSVVSFHFPPPPAGWGERQGPLEKEGKSFHHHCRYPLFDYSRSKELFAEGDKKGWFSERARDFEGTLRERPREIKELVRTAGLTDVRKLAQAGAALVECEKRERERMQKEREMESKMSKLFGKETTQDDEKSRKQRNSKSNQQLPAPTSTIVPPIMVNVIFDTNQSTLLRGAGRIRAKQPYSGRTSPSDQESLHHRMILFEKKRSIELTSSPQQSQQPPLPTTSTSPSYAKKRKGAIGSSGDRGRRMNNWSASGNIDGACDSSDWGGDDERWDQDHGLVDENDDGYYEIDDDDDVNMDGTGGMDEGKSHSSGTGMYKKLRTGNENSAREMSDLLAEFMYY